MATTTSDDFRKEFRFTDGAYYKLLSQAERASLTIHEKADGVFIGCTGKYLNANRSDRYISLNLKQKQNVLNFLSELKRNPPYDNLIIYLGV